ncbi:MAG: hypothetical protein ACMUIG_01060 [Thermoplasmatota archaeon]
MRFKVLMIAVLLFATFFPLVDGVDPDNGEGISASAVEFRTPSRDPGIATIFDILELPENVIYKRSFSVTGELLRDNNGNGERDAGDTLIPNATVNVLWNENTAIVVDRDLVTNETSEENPGRFTTHLSANHVPGFQAIDLTLSFWGQFSNETGDLYGLTESQYSKLIALEYGEDDDGDGSVDEEMLNGIDDDGDFRIDEDVDAYLVTDPVQLVRTVDILHLTELTVNLESDDIELGHPQDGLVSISGQLKDTSETGNDMGTKVLGVYFGDELVDEIEARSSPGNPGARFSYSFAPHNDTPAGDYELKIIFDPDMNETNRFFNATDDMQMVRVYRPLQVVFHDIPEGFNQVYVKHGFDVYINLSIVDRLLYNDGTMQGPLLDLNGNDYDGLYTFNVQWGEPGNSYHITYKGMVIRNESGYFSLRMEYNPARMPIGLMPVMIVSTFNLGSIDPPIYYSNLEGDEYASTTFNIMGDTEIRVWTDQNQNDIDDFRETDKTGELREIYITRTQYESKTGVVQNWNVARIRGQLVDLSQSSDERTVGVPGKEIRMIWNLGDASEFSPEPAITDLEGLFAFDIEIDEDHEIGPVPIRVVYDADLTKGSYASSSFLQTNGTNISVVAATDLSHNIEGGGYQKGEDISISGKLIDDHGDAMAGREIEVYLLHGDEYQPGEPVRSDTVDRLAGTATTDDSGNFRYELNIGESMDVGKYWLYAIFRGSEEYPGDGSLRYQAGDAYAGSVVQPVPVYVISEILIDVNESKMNYTRESGGSIEGWILEVSGDSLIPINPAGNSVQAYLIQGEDQVYLGDNSQFGPNSSFKFVVGRISDKFEKGEITIMLKFNPGNNIDGVSLYKEKISNFTGYVWERSWIKEIEFGPQDDYDRQDGKPDILEWNISSLRFSFQLLDGEGAAKSGPPIPGQPIWFNITMLSFKNSNLLTTDEDGRIFMEFTTNLTDTETGEVFKIPEGWSRSDLNISVFFPGGAYARSSELIYRCTFRVLVPDEEVIDDEDESGEKGISPIIIAGIIVVVLLILIGIIVAVFLVLRGKEEPEEERIKFEDVIHETLLKLEGLQPYHETMMKAISDMSDSLGMVSALDDYGNVSQEFKEKLLEKVEGNEEILEEIVLMIEDSERDHSLMEDLSRKRAILWLKQIEEEVFQKEAGKEL